MVDQGKCPCLTSGRTAQDLNTDSPWPGWLGLCAILRDTWKIRPLTVLLREAIFSTTANSRLPFTKVSLILKKLWHGCNDAGKSTHPWNEAKPKWGRVSSGRLGCRTSYNFPSPTSLGGALLFALHILLALEIYILWPLVAVIVSRYSCLQF